MSSQGTVPRQAAGQPPRQANEQNTASGGLSFNKILIGVVLYFGVNIGLSIYNQKPQSGVQVDDPKTGAKIMVPSHLEDIPPFQLRPNHLDEGATYSDIPKRVAPIWPQDSEVDISVVLSASFNPTPLSKTPAEYLVLQEKNFRMDDRSDKRTVETNFKLPEVVQQNGTLWGHFYIGLAGSVLDPWQTGFNPERAYHFSWPMTQYLVKKKIAKTRNLLSDLPQTVEVDEEDTSGLIITNHYHPNASFAFVPAMGIKDYGSFHPAVKQFVHLEATGARDGSGQNAWYYPVLFVNTFWQLRSHMMPLNDTVKELPLYIDLSNMWGWQFQTLAAMEAGARENARQAAFGNAVPGGGDGSEMEMIKEIFIDTNPYLLGITAIVSVAHIFLEMMAFGSDIAHYRKKKDNVGISVRSILANVFMQSIIFLYLLDNSQNTSWMILGTQVMGIFIELWKVTTVVDVRVRPAPPGSWLPYSVVFEDKQELTETEKQTQQFDQIAFKYMYVAGVPLLIAYGIYSLYYDTHKSWYSYIITTLVGAVYAYGFLLMVPSLYINYRLKSVAHMPAKAMMYKFLNTFIDDLFAFTIKMPILHRLATFRDDVIFFIYLYQKWAYKTDYTRVNEFGQGGDEEEEEDKKKQQAEGKVLAAEKSQAIEAKATGADTGRATKRK